MQGKTVLITGGNCGIGLATAGALGKLGARVVIASRDEARGRRAITELHAEYGVDAELIQLDLASFDSIHRGAERFLARHAQLDVLINNAGLALSGRRETEDGFEYVLGVNHLGHFLLTNLLLERLKQSAPSRIVNLSSAAHVGARKGIDWEDLQRQKKYDGQSYCQAKLGTIYYSRILARRLEDSNVSVFAVNPGFVTTRFGKDGDATGMMKLFYKLGDFWMAKADHGARTSVYAAADPDALQHNGGYLENCAAKKPLPIALDDAQAERFWRVSEELVAEAETRRAARSTDSRHQSAAPGK